MTANWRTCAPHDERWNRLDHKMQSAFGEGRAAGERGRYLSDNPHAYESAPWEAWRLGFAEAQPRTGTHHPSNNSA